MPCQPGWLGVKFLNIKEIRKQNIVLTGVYLPEVLIFNREGPATFVFTPGANGIIHDADEDII
jgi:hypothetical protein